MGRVVALDFPARGRASAWPAMIEITDKIAPTGPRLP